MKIPYKVFVRLGLISILNLTFQNAFAEAQAKEGFYLGLAQAKASVGGDFDGQSFLTDGTEVVLIPKIEDGTGKSILLGFRYDSGAFEINYFETSHDDSFLGIKGESKLKSLSMDFKVYFLTNMPIQPYLLFGAIFFSELHVKDGAGTGSSVYDAIYKGHFGADLGVGVSYYVTPNLAINAGLTNRYITYDMVQTREAKEISEGVNGNGRLTTVGITYTF